MIDEPRDHDEAAPAGGGRPSPDAEAVPAGEEGVRADAQAPPVEGGDPPEPGDRDPADPGLVALLPSSGGPARVLPPDPAGTQPKVDRAELVPRDRARNAPALPPGGRGNPPPVGAPAAGAGPAGAGPLASSGDAPHAERFQFVLGGLIAVAIAAVAALGLMLGSPGSGDRAENAWSPWQPSGEGVDAVQEIAEFVGPQYRLPGGEQLVLVTGGELEVADLPMQIALRAAPDEGGTIRLLDGDAVLYRLCGLGPKCSIDSGRPSVSRHLLLRREALELALYTFRYVGGTDQVVVFLPPPPGRDPDQALLFRRDDVESELRSPLRATLTAPPPSVRTVRRSREARFVDRLTTRGLFHFSLTQANQDENVFLVLEPFDPARPRQKDAAGGSGARGSADGGANPAGSADDASSGAPNRPSIPG